jgi:hypothetical protein
MLRLQPRERRLEGALGVAERRDVLRDGHNRRDDAVIDRQRARADVTDAVKDGEFEVNRVAVERVPIKRRHLRHRRWVVQVH